MTHHYLEAFQSGYAQIRDEVDGLTEEQMNYKPANGGWSIHEIIIHVVDAELVHIHRMKSVIAEETPLLTAFDQDKWSERLNYAGLDYNLYLLLFRTLRESFIPILKNLSAQDYQRMGRHNTAGEMTLEEILEHTIDHVADHIHQIRRVKKEIFN